MNRHGPVLTAVVAAVLMSIGTRARGEPPATSSDAVRTEVHDELKRIWDSLSSLRFVSEEYAVDAEGKRGRHLATIRFALAPGDRTAYSLDVGEDGMPLKTFSFLSDGTRQYNITSFDGHPDSVDSIEIRNQPDAGNRYSGFMSRASWFFIPGGKPLHLHSEEGGRVNMSKGNEGKPRYEVITSHKGKILRCELDPDHDWMIRRVIVGDREAVLEATRFDRDNGRWFPAEGRNTVGGLKGSVTGFRLASLAINRPLPEGMFRPATIPDGAIVDDRTRKDARRTITGGAKARQRLIDRYPAAPIASAPKIVVTASESPPRFPWALVLGSASVLALGGGLALRSQRTPRTGA